MLSFDIVTEHLKNNAGTCPPAIVPPVKELAKRAATFHHPDAAAAGFQVELSPMMLSMLRCTRDKTTGHLERVVS